MGSAYFISEKSCFLSQFSLKLADFELNLMKMHLKTIVKPHIKKTIEFCRIFTSFSKRLSGVFQCFFEKNLQKTPVLFDDFLKKYGGKSHDSMSKNLQKTPVLFDDFPKKRLYAEQANTNKNLVPILCRKTIEFCRIFSTIFGVFSRFANKRSKKTRFLTWHRQKPLFGGKRRLNPQTQIRIWVRFSENSA